MVEVAPKGLGLLLIQGFELTKKLIEQSPRETKKIRFSGRCAER